MVNSPRETPVVSRQDFNFNTYNGCKIYVRFDLGYNAGRDGAEWGEMMGSERGLSACFRFLLGVPEFPRPIRHDKLV